MKRRILVALGVVVIGVWAVDALVFDGDPAVPHLKTLLPLTPATAEPQGVALLVNGGLGLGKNHRRYWNNLSLSYIALKQRGWKRIVALDADGTVGKPDRNVRSFLALFDTGERDDSPLDLDNDGAADVTGPATKAGLEAALAAIGPTLRPEDSFVLYLIDHGQLRIRDGKLTSAFMLWEEEIYSHELMAMLDRHIGRDRWVALLGSMCHSNFFLKEIDRPNTMFISAGRPLWIWSDQDYGVFAYHFAEALLGKTPETGAVFDGDANKDGRVDFREALASAIRLDHVPEWPAYWVNGDETQMPPEF